MLLPLYQQCAEGRFGMPMRSGVNEAVTGIAGTPRLDACTGGERVDPAHARSGSTHREILAMCSHDAMDRSGDDLCGEGLDDVWLYSVSLCRRWDVEQRCAEHRPDELNELLQVATHEERLSFAFNTARQWSLPCWRHDWASPGDDDLTSMTRLC